MNAITITGNEVQVLVQLLTQLVSGQAQGEDVDTGDTTFRYKLLSALMTATPDNSLVAEVARGHGGLDITRPAHVPEGTFLSFVADGKAVELPVVADRVSATALRTAKVDVNGVLDAFVLRDGKGALAVVLLV